MKLLVITNDWQPIEGGIATLTEQTAIALAQRGHSVTVLAPAINPQLAPAQPGLIVERWRGYSLGWFRLFPLAVRALRRIRDFDAVLAMNPGYGGVIAAFSRLLGGPRFLCWSYGFELRKASGTPIAWVYRHVFRRSTAAIAISAWTHACLLELGVPAERVVIVHPGVTLPLAPARPTEIRRRLGVPAGPIVLSVGRLVDRKGHGQLLSAMSRVFTDHPDVSWVVAGRGPERDRLQRRIIKLGLEARVFLLGYVPDSDLQELYRESSVFALLPRETPRDGEGFGLVFLEASSYGVPVVAGRSGGVADAVSNGQTGFLVDPLDDAAAAAAISRILSEPLTATRLSVGGLSLAARTTWGAQAAAIEVLLR